MVFQCPPLREGPEFTEEFDWVSSYSLCSYLNLCVWFTCPRARLQSPWVLELAVSYSKKVERASREFRVSQSVFNFLSE